jgi:hypothetical protein
MAVRRQIGELDSFARSNREAMGKDISTVPVMEGIVRFHYCGPTKEPTAALRARRGGEDATSPKLISRWAVAEEEHH